MPESRPGPSHYDRAPRRRHDSHESETPLMKRSKFEAIQRTKARNQNTPTEQRYCVGVGYKWSEKPTAKGSKKYRPPRRPHQ
ncbi:uncharacterized protein AKAME5_000206600 [Lates japonicus]|uniref:Uncharacterized protein n=1 Tax=Lates japonicus TaxID=270547 RepID=A0AAD3QY70_LATJO|nr:uncharacterized protein AKAME5_000206600 [Lates japonicus]